MSNESDDKKEKAESKSDDAVPKGDAMPKEKSDKENLGKAERANDTGVKGEAAKPGDDKTVKSVKVSEKSVSTSAVSKPVDVPKERAEKADVAKKESPKPEEGKADTEKKQIGKNEEAASVVRHEVDKTQSKQAEAKEAGSEAIEPRQASVKDAGKSAGTKASAHVNANIVTEKNEALKHDNSKRAQSIQNSEVAKSDAGNNATDGDVRKSEAPRNDVAKETPDGNVHKSEAAKNNAENSALRNDVASADTAKKKPDQEDVVINRDASVTTTISPGNMTTEGVSIDAVPGSRTIAQNIFPESMHVKNLSGLLEPTLPPSQYNQETYAAIVAAAEDFDYESRQDVISSVQNILKPKGEFLSRAELLQASKQLRKVMPYNFEAWRLHADILLNALRQLETRQIMPDESFQILAIPLRENDIRDAAEAALRECAHFAGSEERRIRLIDEANSVRRLTWF